MRVYFYTICHKGRVYTADTIRRNLATAIKDPFFLDFFLSTKRIKPFSKLLAQDKYKSTLLQLEEYLQMNTKQIGEKYPFVSICGEELNFIEPEDTVIVFNRYGTWDSNDYLCYASSRYVLFEPNRLRISDDGRIYHPVTLSDNVDYYGLISSDLLTGVFQHAFQNNDGLFTFHWNGNKTLLEAMKHKI